MKRVMTVVGARPQFVKAAIVGAALQDAGIEEFLVHTGQHYDDALSAVFFRELMPEGPDINLAIGSGPHGRQTGEMLARLEELMVREAPSLVLVYGDTNSTLAGALAAVKIHLPVAHVEAGARNFDLTIPEEVNRLVTDRVSTLLFCATPTNEANLRREGITAGVSVTGDVMLDVFLRYRDAARERRALLDELGVSPGEYVLATFHRPSNVDDPETLAEILGALSACGRDVVFPVHPRTQEHLRAARPSRDGARMRMIAPVGYLDSLALVLSSSLVVTDSGGLQREAYFAGRPCVTVFESTAWPETVEEGWNRVVAAKADAILQAMATAGLPSGDRRAFGDGRAAQRVARALKDYLGGERR